MLFFGACARSGDTEPLAMTEVESIVGTEFMEEPQTVTEDFSTEEESLIFHLVIHIGEFDSPKSLYLIVQS